LAASGPPISTPLQPAGIPAPAVNPPPAQPNGQGQPSMMFLSPLLNFLAVILMVVVPDAQTPSPAAPPGSSSLPINGAKKHILTRISP
jgi:hypothetical protein